MVPPQPANKHPPPAGRKETPPMSNTAEVPTLLTPDEVATRLKVKKQTVLRLAQAGKIEAYKLGNGTKRISWRFSPEAVRKYLRDSFQPILAHNR